MFSLNEQLTESLLTNIFFRGSRQKHLVKLSAVVISQIINNKPDGYISQDL